MPRSWRWLLIFLLPWLAACAPDPVVEKPLPTGARVLVIGDSLVAGTGAGQGLDWPTRLALDSGWRVVNAGIPGHTSGQAAARLPELLARHRPDAVIIAVGGNDFLRRHPLADTRRHLEALITTARQGREHVALLAVPQAGLAAAWGSLEDHPLFTELAEQHGITLVPNAISEVLSDDALKADPIHANAAGYGVLAERVLGALDEQGWR